MAPLTPAGGSVKKIKVLLLGPINGQIDVCVSKLRTLQGGKAGPFDVCFSVGPSGIDSSETCLEKLKTDLPFPLYLQTSPFSAGNNNISANGSESESNGAPPPLTLQEHSKLVTIDTNGNVSEAANDPSGSGSEPASKFSPSRSVLQVADTKVFYLCDNSAATPSANLWAISAAGHDAPLLVASCPPHVRHDAVHSKPLLGQTAGHDSVAVDLLLTSDWPQGVETLVVGDASASNRAPSSFDVAAIAKDVKPRYHISAHGFAQSPPYAVQQRACRFLGMASVVPGKTDKWKKYVHALGLAPGEITTSSHSSVKPSPFETPVDSAAAAAAAPMPGSSALASGSGAYSRFATNTRKRPRNDGEDGEGNNADNEFSLEPPESAKDSKTLFLYGLHRDVTGELQSTTSSVLLLAFRQHGVQTVRHPPGSITTAYCFLEFADHATARACLQATMGKVTVNGVDLSLKWGSPKENSGLKRAKLQQVYVSQEEAADSTSLYFHPPQNSGKQLQEYTIDDESPTEDAKVAVEDGSKTENKDGGVGAKDSHVTGDINNSFGNELRRLVESSLENSLNEGNGEGDERVTAATEPALAVGVRCKERYGFLEFASHAAATMALAALTKHTDGGPIVAAEGVPDHLVDTQLRWARGSKTKGDDERDSDNYLGLQRKHFPADARTDCWFCLASATCERHLITGVYDGCYCAIPKGSVHPGHVLIVPVTHSSKGIWQHEAAVRDEVQELLGRLRRHASEKYDSDLFVFERAIQTRGGYHTHVQCVPVPRDASGKIRTTLQAHAKGSGFELRPVQSDLGVTSIVNNGDNDEGYFYAELGTRGGVDRFIYQGPHKVPLQFGREVIAAALHKPELAHWKSCVVDAEKEEASATAFRESFAAYNE